jgi:hypothetical protein
VTRVGANATVEFPTGITPDVAKLAKGASAYVDAGDASAVVFFPDGRGKTLRGKLTQYGDPAKAAASGAPRNNKLVAPIERIRRPTLTDLSAPWNLQRELDLGLADAWVELWVAGGRFGDSDLRQAIRRALQEFTATYGMTPYIERFEAAEHDIYLVQITADGIRQIPDLLPAVTTIRESSQARLEREARRLVGDVVDDDSIDPPDDGAPSIAVLDTGISEGHPLLRRALVAPGVSVVPGVESAQDAYPGGHGTGMAGGVAYLDLAGDIVNGRRLKPRCWIANVRLWNDQAEAFWASRTEEAVLAGEAMAGTVKGFLLCISSGARPRTARTSWSYAVDRLAFNEGEGRLLCVAAGNVAAQPDPNAYPATNQSAEIHDPAQAVNALTVGGFTDLDAQTWQNWSRPRRACR